MVGWLLVFKMKANSQQDLDNDISYLAWHGPGYKTVAHFSVLLKWKILTKLVNCIS